MRRDPCFSSPVEPPQAGSLAFGRSRRQRDQPAPPGGSAAAGPARPGSRRSPRRRPRPRSRRDSGARGRKTSVSAPAVERLRGSSTSARRRRVERSNAKRRGVPATARGKGRASTSSLSCLTLSGDGRPRAGRAPAPPPGARSRGRGSSRPSTATRPCCRSASRRRAPTERRSSLAPNSDSSSASPLLRAVPLGELNTRRSCRPQATSWKRPAQRRAGPATRRGSRRGS